MNITALSIRRPITIIMILGFFVLAGLVAFTKIPVRRLPNVNFPFIRVVISDPGASSSTVAETITTPVENALSSQTGVVQMVGTSGPGRSMVALQYVSGTNVTQVSSSVSLALAKIARRLPSSASAPAIMTANPNALPMMNIAVYGPLASSQLYQLATNTVAPAIQEIPGVAAATVVGGRPPVVNVTLNQTALTANGVSLTQVMGALKGQNVQVNGGPALVGNSELATKTVGGYTSVQALRSLPVLSRAGSTVLLGDVATVQPGLLASQSHATLNGHPAVGLVVTASSTANSLAVDNHIRQTLSSLSQSFPPGVHYAVTGDITNYTRASLSNVSVDLFLGIFMAGMVLLIFLHRLTNTAIVMIAIPVSLISTVAAMYFMGFSLDLISLMALSLLIGILVDDSIVVLENIHRHRLMGKNPDQAALDGRMEIGAAAVAITLTDVVVYAPVAFVSGNVGQLFREFGLTIATATLFSLVVSYTLTPMLAARWNRAGQTGNRPNRFGEWFNRRFERLQLKYRQWITWSLSHRLLVSSLGVMALAGSVAIVRSGVLPTTFVPREDNGVLTVNASLPPGTPLSLSQSTLSAFGAKIQHLHGVQQVFLSTGYAGGKGAAHNRGQITVDLAPKGTRPSIYQYVRRIDRLARKYPGLAARGHVQNPLVVGGGRAATVNVLGPNLSVLDNIANQMVASLAHNAAVSQVNSSVPSPVPQLSVQVNQAEAAYYGVSTTAVGDAVALAVGTSSVPPLVVSSTAPSMPIHVALTQGSALTPAQIENIPVSSSHGTIPLSDVANIVETTGSNQISQMNREYMVSVSASSTSGNVGTATAALETAAHQVGLPTGYAIQLGGQAAQQQRAFGPLIQAFFLSIVLVYMLMAALYESLIDPLAVLLSLPMATIGGLLGLLATGQALSIFSILAMIMLMGLVAKNAILLIDYTKTLMKRGVERNAAIVQAGSTRIRPILMTTATMVGSMLPLALSHGSGSSQRIPIAVVLIGGLTTSTVLTLLVVPVIYSLLDDLRIRIFRVRRTASRAKVLGAEAGTHM